MNEDKERNTEEAHRELFPLPLPHHKFQLGPKLGLVCGKSAPNRLRYTPQLKIHKISSNVTLYLLSSLYFSAFI